MIDIHTHIVPNVDDGCDDINESLEIIKKAKDNGITKIFATPHYKYGVYDSTKQDVISYINSINDLLKISNIDIEILVGHEIMVCSDMLEILKNDKLCSLNDSKYILIEFNMGIKPYNISKLIYDIVCKGYIPIIAHPERYEYIKKDVKQAIKYVESGALLQMDLGSILGYYGSGAKDAVIKLLKHNIIHLWGSDVHKNPEIYYELAEGFKQIKKYVSKEDFNYIKQCNAKKIYNNEDIDIFDIKEKIGFFR